MARVETHAICLRHWPFSETSQTVLLLGETTGLVRAIAKGSRRDDPRFSGGVELTDVAVADVIVPESGALATLAGWDLARVFPGVRRHATAFDAAMFSLDFVAGFLGELDPHPESYRALVTLLGELDQGVGGSMFPALVRFEWAVLGDVGYRPTLEGEADAAGLYRFGPDRGGLGAEPGERAWDVRAGTVDRLRALGGGWSGAGDGGGDGAGPDALAGERVDERGAALLAAYARELLGRPLAGEERVFSGGLPHPGA